MKTMGIRELNRDELAEIGGGEVSSDTLYGVAVGVSLAVLGALATIATAGVAAPVVVTVSLGVLGTVANGTAIAAATAGN